MPSVGDHIVKASFGGSGTYTDLPGEVVLIDDLNTSTGATGQLRASSPGALAPQESRNTNRAIKITDDNNNICLIVDGFMQLGYPYKPGEDDKEINVLFAESPVSRDDSIFSFHTAITETGTLYQNRNIIAFPPLGETVKVTLKPFGTVENPKTGSSIRDGYVEAVGSLHKYQYVIESIQRQANTGRTDENEIIYRDPNVEYPVSSIGDNMKNGRLHMNPGVKKFELACYKKVVNEYYPRFNIELTMCDHAVIKYTNQLDVNGNPDWENVDSDENWFSQNDLHYEVIDAQMWNGSDANVWYDLDGYSFFTADSQANIPSNIFPCYARLSILLTNGGIEQWGELNTIHDLPLYYPGFGEGWSDDQENLWYHWGKDITLQAPVDSGDGVNICQSEWTNPGTGATGENKYIMGFPSLTSSDRAFIWQDVESHGDNTEKLNIELTTQDIQLAQMDDYGFARTVSIRYRSDKPILVKIMNEKNQSKEITFPPTQGKLETKEAVVGLRCKYMNINIVSSAMATDNDIEIHQIEVGYQ